MYKIVREGHQFCIEVVGYIFWDVVPTGHHWVEASSLRLNQFVDEISCGEIASLSIWTSTRLGGNGVCYKHLFCSY